ncbi:hypothetical protein GCM10010254_22160 [Streptomyces chromofuscus]|nr:hypothetical protein GCM10010254_22160 [Streptomyces chromofuscus]
MCRSTEYRSAVAQRVDGERSLERHARQQRGEQADAGLGCAVACWTKPVTSCAAVSVKGRGGGRWRRPIGAGVHGPVQGGVPCAGRARSRTSAQLSAALEPP